MKIANLIGGRHWCLQYCGISQFFMRYFSDFKPLIRAAKMAYVCL